MTLSTEELQKGLMETIARLDRAVDLLSEVSKNQVQHARELKDHAAEIIKLRGRLSHLEGDLDRRDPE